MPAPSAAPGDVGLEPEPAAAASVFGPSLPIARRYAALLATTGVERGLLGPSEAGRIWSRHLLNSAVVAELLPPAARVVDVGSGAGLPGIALALTDADLDVTLVEPLERRVRFLTEAVASLGLAARARVVRGRAGNDDIGAAVGGAEIVVARAVAPIDRLVRWCLPLLVPGGWLLAIKGASARDELTEHLAAIRRAGAEVAEVVTCGSGIIEPPTAVMRISRRSKGNDTG